MLLCLASPLISPVTRNTAGDYNGLEMSLISGDVPISAYQTLEEMITQFVFMNFQKIVNPQFNLY